MDEIDVTVHEVVQETPLDRTLRMTVAGEALDAFDFVPGQYLCVWDPAETEGPRRYFSISGGDPETGRLQVTIRRSPDAEPPFYATPEGTPLRSEAPAGRFVLDYADDDHLVLLGGGSGITPFRAYVEALTRMPDAPPTTLFQSERDPAQLVFREELTAWDAAHEWFRYVPVVTGGDGAWEGRTGRIDEAALERVITAPDRTIVCACGPAAFVDAVLAAAEALGVPEERLRREGW